MQIDTRTWVTRTTTMGVNNLTQKIDVGTRLNLHECTCMCATLSWCTESLYMHNVYKTWTPDINERCTAS